MSTAAYRGLDTLVPHMRYRTDNFLRETRAAGANVIIAETWRSPERQEYLYSLGRTRPGRIVTWTMQSKHLAGEAFDIAFVAPNGNVTYEGDWERVGRIGEMQGLTWGGRWPAADRPHFQLNHDWQRERAFYGKNVS